MRDRSLLLFLAPFAAGLTVHVACVDSDETPSPSLSLDGGGLDASRADVVQPTEPSVDAGVDAADAAAQGVTVVAIRDGVPAPGVTIVFGDLQTGAVLETKQTDANGRTSRDVVGGLHVTAVFGTKTSPELVTIMAAEPGDVVTIVDPSVAPFVTAPSVQITGVPQPTPVDTTGYEIRSGPCGFYATTFPGVYELGPDCVNGSIFPILIEALDDSSRPIAFTSLPSVTMPDGGVDGGLPVTPTAAWAPTDMRTVSLVGVDAGAEMWLTQSEVVSGIPFHRSSSVIADDGGAAAVTLVGHPGFTTTLQHEATSRGSTLQGTAAYRAIATRTSTLGADSGVTLDFSKALPAITSIEIDGGVLNRPTVSWAASSGITEGDGIVTRLTWYDSQDGGEGFTGHWTIVAPPLTSLIATPALPAAVAADYAPSAGAQLYDPTLALVEVSTLPGYRELRQGSAFVRPTNNLINDNYGAVAPILPVDGTVRLTAATRYGD